jgi:hypothetical protein
MKPFYIILQFLFILSICFGATFLMDFEFIKSNWVRYGLIVIFILFILILGSLWIKENIKKL